MKEQFLVKNSELNDQVLHFKKTNYDLTLKHGNLLIEHCKLRDKLEKGLIIKCEAQETSSLDVKQQMEIEPSSLNQ